MKRPLCLLALSLSLAAPSWGGPVDDLTREVQSIQPNSPQAQAQLKEALLKTLALLQAQPVRTGRQSKSSTAPKVAAGPRPVVELIGKRGLTKVHRADCRFGKRIVPETMVRFHSIEEAARQGYTPCKVCQPEVK